MPPLAAENNNNNAFLESANGSASMLQVTTPATPWSCASPALGGSLSSLNQSSSSLHSTDSASSSSSSSASSSTTITARQHSLAMLHRVGSTFRAIIFFLEQSGVARASLRELQRMIMNEQYIAAMDRAAQYIDCILTEESELDSIVVLFEAGWESLRDYSKALFKEAQKEHARYENKYWIEFIETQNLSQSERRRRKRRQLDAYDADKQRKLKQTLWEATRFKIDTEKGLIQTTEWSRYLRGQQRQILRKLKQNQ